MKLTITIKGMTRLAVYRRIVGCEDELIDDDLIRASSLAALQSSVSSSFNSIEEGDEGGVFPSNSISSFKIQHLAGIGVVVDSVAATEAAEAADDDADGLVRMVGTHWATVLKIRAWLSMLLLVDSGDDGVAGDDDDSATGDTWSSSSEILSISGNGDSVTEEEVDDEEDGVTTDEPALNDDDDDIDDDNGLFETK
jgi:hypothetical protein